MSDDKYVPDHEMVRESWIDWSAGCGIGRQTAYDEYERYISDIKAEAWDEGAAYVNSPFGIEPGMRNPYRKDTA